MQSSCWGMGRGQLFVLHQGAAAPACHRSISTLRSAASLAGPRIIVFVRGRMVENVFRHQLHEFGIRHGLPSMTFERTAVGEFPAVVRPFCAPQELFEQVNGKIEVASVFIPAIDVKPCPEAVRR